MSKLGENNPTNEIPFDKTSVENLHNENKLLAALQPYKSPCPRWRREKCKNIFQLFSLVMKTKLVQNVNRMSERQNDMPKDRLTDRRTDRQKDR